MLESIFQALKEMPSTDQVSDQVTDQVKTGLVEKTQPNSPNSPTQKYRLTAQGLDFLSVRKNN